METLRTISRVNSNNEELSSTRPPLATIILGEQFSDREGSEVVDGHRRFFPNPFDRGLTTVTSFPNPFDHDDDCDQQELDHDFIMMTPTTTPTRKHQPLNLDGWFEMPIAPNQSPTEITHGSTSEIFEITKGLAVCHIDDPPFWSHLGNFGDPGDPGGSSTKKITPTRATMSDKQYHSPPPLKHKRKRCVNQCLDTIPRKKIDFKPQPRQRIQRVRFDNSKPPLLSPRKKGIRKP